MSPFQFHFLVLREGKVGSDFLLCLRCPCKWDRTNIDLEGSHLRQLPFLWFTLQFLAVFGPVRLAPPQGASVVPRNTAVNHSVCPPPLQHVQPGSQEGQVLSLACHGFLPSGFPGLHLRPGDKLLTFAGNGWLPKRLRVNLGMNGPPSNDTASLQGYLSGAATWSPRAPPLWGHSFFIPTIQQGQLPPVTRETCRAELGKAGTLPSHATEANKNLIVWGEELGVGKGKASKVGQGGGQGRTLAEPTARGLNACPWVCAGALWELCCDRPLGALGRFPPVFHLWLWSQHAAMTVCVCATKETGLFFIWSMCPQVLASSDYLLRSDWLNPDQISSEGKIDIWDWFPPPPIGSRTGEEWNPPPPPPAQILLCRLFSTCCLCQGSILSWSQPCPPMSWSFGK